jgi:hypothetical protein
MKTLKELKIELYKTIYKSIEKRGLTNVSDEYTASVIQFNIDEFNHYSGIKVAKKTSEKIECYSGWINDLNYMINRS